MIGKWNRSVIATYLGLVASVFGMILCISGAPFSAGAAVGAAVPLRAAFTCLALAGICDLADGPIARRCKRTDEEKEFGVQLDSLVDSVSFVAFPVVLSASLGPVPWHRAAVLAIFAVCGIARLGYFNLMAKANPGGEPLSHYRGLPVTYAALAVPVLGAALWALPLQGFAAALEGALAVLAVLEIADIPIPKPRGAAYAVFALLFLGVLAFEWIFLPQLL